MEVTLPGGQSLLGTYEHTATLADPNDPLSVTELTRVATIGGDDWTIVYDLPSRQITQTTPEGRVFTTTLDANDRIAHEEIPGLAAVDYEYDPQGRLVRILQGDRELLVGFDAASGYLDRLEALQSISGGIGEYQTALFSSDSVGRFVGATAPDGVTTAYSYDDASNLTSMTTSGATQAFEYNSIDQPTRYLPPDLGDGQSREETADYNLDGDVTREVIGDGTEFVATYNAAGQVERLDVSDASAIDFAYQPDGLRLLASLDESGGGRPSTRIDITYNGPDVSSVTSSENGSIVGDFSVDTSQFFSMRQISERVNGANTVVFEYDADELLISAGPVKRFT